MSIYPIERIGTEVSLYQVENDPDLYRDCWGEAIIDWLPNWETNQVFFDVIFTHRQTHRVFKAKDPVDARFRLLDGQPPGYIICHTPLIKI